MQDGGEGGGVVGVADGGGACRGWWVAIQRSPPGNPSTARPVRSESASPRTRTGCHGGVNRVIAPGRACQANTSPTGAATVLRYVNPTISPASLVGTVSDRPM